MLASVWTLSNVNPNTRKSRMPLTRFLSHKTGQELHKKSVSIHTHTWWFTIWLPLKHQSAKIITICEREKESFVSYEKCEQSVSRKRPFTGRKTHLLCRTDKKILLYPIWALSSYIPISSSPTHWIYCTSSLERKEKWREENTTIWTLHNSSPSRGNRCCTMSELKPGISRYDQAKMSW